MRSHQFPAARFSLSLSDIIESAEPASPLLPLKTTFDRELAATLARLQDIRAVCERTMKDMDTRAESCFKRLDEMSTERFERENAAVMRVITTIQRTIERAQPIRHHLILDGDAVVVDDKNIVKPPSPKLPAPSPRPEQRCVETLFFFLSFSRHSLIFFVYPIEVVGKFTHPQLTALVRAVRAASSTDVEIPVANFVRAILNLAGTNVSVAPLDTLSSSVCLLHFSRLVSLSSHC